MARRQRHRRRAGRGLRHRDDDGARVCQSCGAENAIGAHRAYRGAGHVLRCPACEDVAARIAVLPDRHVVVLSGRWRIEIGH